MISPFSGCVLVAFLLLCTLAYSSVATSVSSTSPRITLVVTTHTSKISGGMAGVMGVTWVVAGAAGVVVGVAEVMVGVAGVVVGVAGVVVVGFSVGGSFVVSLMASLTD